MTNINYPLFNDSVKPSQRISIWILSFFIISALPVRAQLNYLTSKAAGAEKIYVQLDNNVYTTDNTIWFKAIVTCAADNSTTKLSSVLYVELIEPNEMVLEKKLIKLQNGIGEGNFDLTKHYREGQYMIRAYTEWNKNFDTDFIFTEYIHVFQPTADIKTTPIRGVTIVDEQNNNRRLTASFDPIMIDSLHKKDLKLILTLDKKSDTLLVKKSATGKYLLDYALPADCQFATLQMLTTNLHRYSKTIVLNEDYLDLQFFPESGELVNGLPGKVAFKALDYRGKGKMVEGDILDAHDSVVTSFKSNSLGMGSVMLPNADTAVVYLARIKSKTEKKLSLMYHLPRVAAKGNMLSVHKEGDNIQLTALSNYLYNDSICIRVSCRGLMYFDIKGRLKEGKLRYSLPSNTVPEGIIAFTMIDNQHNPVAERLYFNQRPESRITVDLTTDKTSYLQREQTKLTIETTDNDVPIKANASILVLNKEEMVEPQDLRQNILSYFLLSSDLRGKIETPGYYFTKNADKQEDIDVLLLTQGWRKYLYTKPADKYTFKPETSLTASGTVGGVLFEKKKMKNVGLTLMTFGKTKNFLTGTTDSLGKFTFDLNDEYGQNLNILIQSSGKSGKKKDYTIELDKKIAPAVSFLHDNTTEKADSIVHKRVEQARRHETEQAFRLSAGFINLKEVVINGYRMTPERKKVMDAYGKPTTVIDGKDIQKKEEKWSYGLYSIFIFNYGDKVTITRERDGVLYASVDHEPTLVVIDGVPVKIWDYPLIPNIPPSEVLSFEIIKNAKNFMNLFLEVFPYADPFGAPPTGNVIAIYTAGKSGIYGTARAVGIVQAAIPVFSTPREFYVPNYENLQPSDWVQPDFRSLVYWKPQLVTDSLGKASASFYNADNMGKMQVVVEAIGENGEIGYQELLYDVKKNPKAKQLSNP